jgi:Hedgehog amino-terminal signalling domain
MTAPIGLKTAGPQVVLEGVDEKLLFVIGTLDRIHQDLFASQLVITSGRDGLHAAGSLHAEGKAIDVRTNDKDAANLQTFLGILAHAARLFPITYFDEHNLPGAPHIHIEWHGV